MLGVFHHSNSSPLKWMLVRITDTHPDVDNDVRMVSIRTLSDTTLKRPVLKFSPLPILDNGEG